MATTDWQKSSSIKDHLFAEPYRYEFHQAVRILEQIYPDLVALGDAVNPETEVVSISARVEYAYPPSDIYTLKKPIGSAGPIRMRVNFWGLAGANGPLPMPFTEQLIRRNQQGDFAFQDFLDIFNHRLLSIFHRIRKKYWLGLAQCPPDQSRVAQVLFSLCGLGLDSTRNRLTIPDRALLYYSGLLWQQPPSMAGLQAILKDYFSIDVEVEAWIGRWVPIEAPQQTRLGKDNAVLGETAALGRRFWDQMQTIRLQLKCTNWEELFSFLPDQENWKGLQDLFQFYLGLDYQTQIVLVLYTTEYPPVRLGQQAKLGWTTWLMSKPMTSEIKVILPTIEKNG
jgi:type VI secretion system protein ImpH